MTDATTKLRALYEASAPGKNGYVGAAMQIRDALPALLDVAEAARAILDCDDLPPSLSVYANARRVALRAAIHKLDEASRG